MQEVINNIDLHEEIRCGYIVTEKQKRIWNIELEILKKFMEVCDKNRLKYFVAHGTLLGAVRHKGFVPWDDDIDVNMPRKDYEKLKEIAKREFVTPFFLQTYENNMNNFVGHAKLRIDCATGMDMRNIGKTGVHNGLFIDIFPMDGIIECKRLRSLQSVKVERYRGLLTAKLYGDEFRFFAQYNEKIWKKYCWESKFLSSDFLNNRFEYWCSKYTKRKSIKREGIIAFKTDYECCYWYKEDYRNIVYLPFENLIVPVPENYDRCLKIKWNNYMEYPPAYLRGYKHNGMIMEPDIGYKEYDLSKYTIDFSAIHDKKIIIFGCGKYGNDFINYVGKKYKICKLIDNDHNKWGKDVKGISIESPDILKDLDQGKYVIVIASSYFIEIEEQLKIIKWSNYYIHLIGRKYKMEG